MHETGLSFPASENSCLTGIHHRSYWTNSINGLLTVSRKTNHFSYRDQFSSALKICYILFVCNFLSRGIKMRNAHTVSWSETKQDYANVTFIIRLFHNSNFWHWFQILNTYFMKLTNFKLHFSEQSRASLIECLHQLSKRILQSSDSDETRICFD